MLRMGGQDAAFLYAETPEWHMHVAALMVVDPAGSSIFSFERLRDLVIERLPELPQFRWRVVDVPLGLDRPGWEEATDFDPDYHIRRIAVPTPGGPAELGELVGRIASYKIDRSRPLWEMWIIEGLEDGRVGVLCKIHHSIIDGSSGAGLAEITLDVSPDPRPPSGEITSSIAHRPVPSVPERIAKGVVNTLVRTPYRIARFGGQAIRQGFDFVGVLRSNRVAMPYTAPRVPFNGPLTAHRSFASARIDLERAKEIRRVLDVKLNDVVLAICAGALRGYLLDLDQLPKASLLAQCPVSVRTEAERDDVGNKVGSLFVTLGTEIADPLQRLQAIHQSTMSAKEMHRAMSVHRIMGLTETTPPGLIALAARAYSATGLDRAGSPVNLVISNVPGPPMPLYMAGARLEAMYPMGPLLFDMALNITVISYCDAIDFGLMSCPQLLPEPADIARRIPSALTELELAIGITTN
jgi:diacylglycerol O-acyltransferase / wax synthase